MVVCMKIRINGECQERVIGHLRDYHGVKAFITHRRPQHWFKKFQGFGFNKGLIEELVGSGVGCILLVYHGWRGTIKYLVSARTVLEHGVLVHYRPFEPQYVIGKQYMVVVE